MEEENNQEIPQTNENVNSSSPKFDFKKYGPIIGIGVAVIAVIAILIGLFSGGPKKAVKKYVKAFNAGNAKKLVGCMDIAGMSSLSWDFDPDNFSDEDYKEFKEKYKEVEKEDIEKAKDLMLDSLKEVFDEMKDEVKSYSVKIKKFTEVKKIKKDLYSVTAEINMKAVPKDKDEEKTDETVESTFIIYKNKIISTDSLF